MLDHGAITDARVVHENIDATPFVFDFFEQFRLIFVVGNVELAHHEAIVLVKALAQSGERFRPRRDHNAIRFLRVELFCDRHADPRAATRNQNYGLKRSARSAFVPVPEVEHAEKASELVTALSIKFTSTEPTHRHFAK